MSKTTFPVERIYIDSNLTFVQIIKSIINHKIEELVNTANKVNTATSQSDEKELGAS